MGYKRKHSGAAEAAVEPTHPTAPEAEVEADAEVEGEEPLEEEEALLPESEIAESEAQPPSLTHQQKWLQERTNNVIIIRHLPHGLYEKELFQFLSQYGEVKRVRVPRSKKTGHPRGCAFVQFARLRVAEQVASDLNGYYLHGHVMRTRLMDPSEVKPGWHNNEALIALDKRIRLYGRPRERVRETPSAFAKPLVKRHTKKEKLRNRRLQAMGLSYSSSFWTDPAERKKRIDTTKQLLAETADVKWQKKSTHKKAKAKGPRKEPSAQPQGKPSATKQKQRAKKGEKPTKDGEPEKVTTAAAEPKVASRRRKRSARRAAGNPQSPATPQSAPQAEQPSGGNGKPTATPAKAGNPEKPRKAA